MRFFTFRLAESFERFVATFIDFPKLIFAVVNGPAVGIMVKAATERSKKLDHFINANISHGFSPLAHFLQ